VLGADIERSELLHQEKEESAKEKGNVALLQRIYARLQEIDADQASVKAGKILHGLGFNAADQQRKTKEVCVCVCVFISFHLIGLIG
jgi:ATPase subunit of ABC transporter with duplicated ATPase domains